MNYSFYEDIRPPADKDAVGCSHLQIGAPYEVGMRVELGVGKISARQ
jgi:hypothetical protein